MAAGVQRRRLQRWLPRSRMGRLGLALLVVVVVSIIGFARYLAAPSQGQVIAVRDSLQRVKKTPSAAAVPPAGTLQSDYFTLPLPAGYRPQAPTAPAGGLLFAQTVTKPGSFGSQIISLAVKPLPAGGLDQDSSYSLRQQQAGRYALSSQAVRGDTVQIANDRQAAAVVAFWPHAGHLATISVSSGLDNPSGDDNADELATLQTILQAWQWR